MMFYIGCALLSAGLVVIFFGVLATLLMPNFFAKIHSAGVIDIQGVPLAMIGLACMQTEFTSSFKLIIIAILVYLVLPAASCALAESAYCSDKNINKK